MFLFNTITTKKSSAKADFNLVVKFRENEFNPGETEKKAKPKEAKETQKKKQVGALEEKPVGLMGCLEGFFKPATLYVDGWGVYLKVSPLRGSFEAEINDEKTEREHLLSIPLYPTGGPQRITAKVTATYGFAPDIKKIVLLDIDTVITPRVYSAYGNGMHVGCEYPGMYDSSKKVLEIIGIIRRLTQPRDSVKVFLFSNEDHREPHFDGGKIYTSARYDDEVSVIACHEECHAVYQRMGEGKETARLKLLEHAHRRLLDAVKITTGKDMQMSWLSVWEEIRIRLNPVVKSFTEGQYPGMRIAAGHPWDNPSENFASVTTVLKFYPERFFYWLEMYDKSPLMDQRLVGITKEIAKDVVKAWGDKPFFPPMVYEKLGLPKP